MRFLIAFVFALSQLPLLANAAGIYLSTELGGTIGTSINTQSRDTDFPTLCDRVLDPQDKFVPVGGCPETSGETSGKTASAGQWDSWPGQLWATAPTWAYG